MTTPLDTALDDIEIDVSAVPAGGALAGDVDVLGDLCVQADHISSVG